MFGELLTLFASTEIFIFVFMEIVTKLETIQRVIFKKATVRDYAVFVVIFGLFSIFGTYIGIPWEHGAISNIRDLAPIVAGFVAGPYIGVAVGLIGGIHRLFLGGGLGSTVLYCDDPCRTPRRHGVPIPAREIARYRPCHDLYRRNRAPAWRPCPGLDPTVL